MAWRLLTRDTARPGMHDGELPRAVWLVCMRVQDLKTHPEPYITVAELATYWLVARKYIYKLIGSGRLRAIRLGPRMLRIRTTEAIQFERRAITTSSQRSSKSSARRRRH